MVKKFAILYMRTGLAIFLIFVLAIVPYIFFQNEELFPKFVGMVTQNFDGPSAEEQQCVRNCASVGCEVGDQECIVKNSSKCFTKCGVEGEPEPADESESCMQECIKVGCDNFDFACQEENRNSCENECNMKGDAPDESSISEEQKCITECVNKEKPGTICQNSQEGETGGRVCKRCAKDCEYLYAGPCLDDSEIRTKQKDCETCKNCYGEPIMGDSGEGWECIIDIQCGDASSEFGDEPGEGPGIGQEGFIARVGDSIGNFFRNIFGGNKEDETVIAENLTE
jgi:hypothetical protein